MRNCLKIYFLFALFMFVSVIGVAAENETDSIAETEGDEKVLDGMIPLEDVVPSQYLAELKSNGMVEFIHEKDDEDLRLLPKSKYSSMVHDGRIKKDRQSYVTESLYLVPKSVLENNSSNAGFGNVDTSIEAVAKILRSVSKMEGMQYFSISDNETDILYNRAYAFASPENREPIADPIDVEADGQVAYAYQHDKSFGDCYYVLKYFKSGNEMLAVFSNLDDMRVAGFNAVKQGKVKFNIVTVDCGDSYVVYIMLDADCMWFPFIRKRLTNSFRSRMNAIYGWFIKQF